MKNWDDLRIFLAVAHAQRIAPAARALGIDATTVGRRLARLEAAVGAALFETLAGERRLSEAGQALLQHAETIDAAILSATEGDRGAGVAGHVRLSVAEGLATHVLSPRLAAFHASHPRIRIDLITASGFLDPSKREADIAVMLARPRNRQLRATRLADYRLRLYATPAYLATHGEPASAAALEAHVLIGYVPEHIHAPELDYLSEVHDGLVARLRSTSINVQGAMVASGAGIGILPDFLAARDERLVPVLPAVSLSRGFWLVTHADGHATPRIQAVSAWLRDAAAAIG
ncbi:LysR family transcriptional regulator [Sphingomonas sp. SUN019]|uniref:LysR family transcriptional regulator n=1 Tax=Sphingomonas sp. SUN019 TaxID=2937788 RepID=UPI0021644467|nr:LysR family transcriptional regulator [Sphingomonas sp. SUN019]UVO50463.1 LysR family transcriptional regulator [Sphingomonas sp. SUN019]